MARNVRIKADIFRKLPGCRRTKCNETSGSIRTPKQNKAAMAHIVN